MIARQPRIPRQHRPERPRPGVLGPHRRVPGVHHHRHPRLGQQPPHLLEERVAGGEPAHLQVHLEDPRPRLQRVGHVPGHPRLGVERRRRQAPRRRLRERHRPRVQVRGHVRPVRIGQRAEHPHAQPPQVRHPLLVAPLVPDRPPNPHQRPRRVEVLPHPAQHPRRQEVRMDVRQPRHPQPPPEPRHVPVLLRRHRVVHAPFNCTTAHVLRSADRTWSYRAAYNRLNAPSMPGDYRHRPAPPRTAPAPSRAVWSGGAAHTSALKISTST